MNTALLTLPFLLSGVSSPALANPRRLGNPYGEEIDYSVEYNGKTYQRLGYVDYSLNYFTNFTISFEPKTIVLGSFDGEFRGTSQSSTGSVITIHYENPNTFNLDDLDLYSDSCVSWLCNTDLGWVYQELFFEQATGNHQSFTWQWDRDNSQWLSYPMDPFNHEYIIEDIFGSFTYLMENEQNPIPFPENTHIPERQPVINNPSLYDIVEDFYDNNLFNNDELENMTASVGANNMSMRSWLSHTATIATLVILFVAVFSLLFGIFRLFAHLTVNLFD